MGAPSQDPVWATAGTNNTEPLAGQKASGWTFEQDIVSSYFNWWMNLVYLWIVALRGGRIRFIPACAGTFRTWTSARANGVGYSPSSGDPLVIPIALPEGEKFTTVSAPLHIFTSSILTLKVFKYDAITETTTQLGSTQTSTGVAGVQTLVVTGLAETGASSGAVFYNAMIELSSGSLNSYGTGLVIS